MHICIRGAPGVGTVGCILAGRYSIAPGTVGGAVFNFTSAYSKRVSMMPEIQCMAGVRGPAARAVTQGITDAHTEGGATETCDYHES